jgi:hypothetical protein
MIIGVGLSVEEEKRLVEMLRENKETLGWKVEDIKGISPSIM